MHLCIHGSTHGHHAHGAHLGGGITVHEGIAGHGHGLFVVHTTGHETRGGLVGGNELVHGAAAVPGAHARMLFHALEVLFTDSVPETPRQVRGGLIHGHSFRGTGHTVLHGLHHVPVCGLEVHLNLIQHLHHASVRNPLHATLGDLVDHGAGGQVAIGGRQDPFLHGQQAGRLVGIQFGHGEKGVDPVHVHAAGKTPVQVGAHLFALGSIQSVIAVDGLLHHGLHVGGLGGAVVHLGAGERSGEHQAQQDGQGAGHGRSP